MTSERLHLDSGPHHSGGPDHNSGPDEIDRIRAEWAALETRRPASIDTASIDAAPLDTAPIDTIGRILRAAALITKRGDDALAEFGLTRGEFEILAALRRHGGPQSPGSLRTVALATGPATTKRLRSLETRQLVVRSANPSDGRGALIELSDRGVALIDEAFPRLLAVERELLSGVPADSTPGVVDALRLVLASVEVASVEAAVSARPRRSADPS